MVSKSGRRSELPFLNLRKEQKSLPCNVNVQNKIRFPLFATKLTIQKEVMKAYSLSNMYLVTSRQENDRVPVSDEEREAHL